MEMAAESPTRRSSASSSPEFEFWMLRNPPSYNPQPPLLSADELFADGILLPLHILSVSPAAPSSLPPQLPLPLVQDPLSEDPSPLPPPSKKWKDIFKPGEKKPAAADKKDRKQFPAVAAPEINIHIWPFSRSRSSGNNRPRAPPPAAGRKTSSAPCSRCNSRGDSSKQGTGGSGAGVTTAAAVAAVRKWAPTPPRAGGIYLGRSNPVWQLKRRNVAGGKKDAGGAGEGRALKTCIGHQIPSSCRECEKDAKSVLEDRSGGGGAAAAAAVHGEENAVGEVNGSLFSLRAIFTRKVH